jgi:hypothetical protein
VDGGFVAHQISSPNSAVPPARTGDERSEADAPPGRSVVVQLRIKVVVAALVAFVVFRYVFQPAARWLVDRAVA